MPHPKDGAAAPISLARTQSSTSAPYSPSPTGNSKHDEKISVAHRRWKQCSPAADDCRTIFCFEYPITKKSGAPADLYCRTGAGVVGHLRRLRNHTTVDMLVGGVLRQCSWHLRNCIL